MDFATVAGFARVARRLTLWARSEGRPVLQASSNE